MSGGRNEITATGLDGLTDAAEDLLVRQIR
jgi:hypothetical protein